MRKPLAKFSVISFDVGGTLIEPFPSVGHIYASVASEFGQSHYSPETLSDRFCLAWKEKVNFDYSERAWSEVVVKTFGGAASEFGEWTPFFERLYARFLDPSAWRIYDDVIPVLSALRNRGVCLAVVSNWDRRLRPLLKALELDRFFSEVEVSAESGYHKPAREIFDKLVGRLGIPAEKVLHVGDSRREDVEGAKQAGLNALLINRRGKGNSPDEISSLLEVLRHCEGSGKEKLTNQGV